MEEVVYHQKLKMRNSTVLIAYIDKNGDKKDYRFTKTVLMPQNRGVGSIMVDAMNAFCKDYSKLEVDQIVDLWIEVEAAMEDAPGNTWYIR